MSAPLAEIPVAVCSSTDHCRRVERVTACDGAAASSCHRPRGCIGCDGPLVVLHLGGPAVEPAPERPSTRDTRPEPAFELVRDAWNTGREPSWGYELAIGPSVGTREGVLAAGARGSLGVRRRSHFVRRAPADDMGWLVPFVAAPTLGLIFVPSGAWVGNERGVDVRARWSVANGADEIMVGLAPVFRVALEGSAIRLPAVVNYVAPELGFSTRSDGGPAGYVAWNVFPFARRLGPHAAIDLEPLVGIRVPGEGAGATLIASMTVAIAVR